MKLQLSQKQENEPAENAENTVTLGNSNMVSEIYTFTLTMENLQFNWDQFKTKYSSEKGLT